MASAPGMSSRQRVWVRARSPERTAFVETTPMVPPISRNAFSTSVRAALPATGAGPGSGMRTASSS
jgi:hypothetical protein